MKTLTSYDPEQSCGIGNLSIEGMDPGKLASHLWQEQRILVTPIRVEGQYAGIRVTPNVYTTLDEIDTFSEAVEKAVKTGI